MNATVQVRPVRPAPAGAAEPLVAPPPAGGATAPDGSAPDVVTPLRCVAAPSSRAEAETVSRLRRAAAGVAVAVASAAAVVALGLLADRAAVPSVVPGASVPVAVRATY